MVASSVSSLSWAERAKKANNSKSLPMPPTLNVWNLRKEQRAAAVSARPSASAPHPSAAVAPPSQTAPSEPSIAATTPPVLSTDSDDDPFVVRVPPNRERNPIQVPTLDDHDTWPEVGKSSFPKPNKERDDHDRGDASHTAGTASASKKGDKKWIPMPAEEWQQPTESRTRPHSIKNGHSTQPQHGSQTKNTSAATNGGNPSATQSRATSGHSSVSQSTAQSRINSRSGSVQSSPRVPRNKRLPQDESGAPTPPDNNPLTNVPLVALGPPLSDIQMYTETHPLESATHVPMAYPTPLYGQDNVLTSYYPRQPPFTSQHYRHPSGHSPSNTSYRSSQNNTPPLYQPPPIHYTGAPAPYPLYPHYAPSYDYNMASSQPSYLYWNNPTHPGAGDPHQAYPTPGITGHYPGPSPHSQALRSPDLGPTHYSDTIVSDERSYIQHSTRVPLPPEQSQAVAGYVPAPPFDVESGRKEPVTFGSIDAPDAVRSPALGSPRPPDETKDEKLDSEIETIDKKLTYFTIGMGGSEVESARLRSRTRSLKGRSRTSTGASSPTETTSCAEVKFVDLTDQETKWKFGFAEGNVSTPPPLPPQESLPLSVAGASTTSAVPPLSDINPSVPFDPSLGIPTPGIANQVPQNPIPSSETDIDGSDTFRVVDYGYGFRRHPAPDGSRDIKLPPERRDRDRDYVERDQDKDGDGERAKNDYRPRRGYGQFDRGYGGRRGGRGSNGYPRGYGRNYHPRGVMHSHRPPPGPAPMPLAAPPPQFPPNMVPIGEPLNGYFPQQVPPFIPQSYDTYGPSSLPTAPVQFHQPPPMPPPRTQILYNLDPTRYWLLGQLEYYLSPQNLAQDLYLRKQMDARGWISMATLASFKRVQNLTHDYQTVKYALTLSGVLDVKDDWVRMHGWESFVLPDAPASQVESAGGEELATGSAEGPTTGRSDGTKHGEPDGEVEDEEEEEEDVVFVMGKEAGWSPHGTRH